MAAYSRHFFYFYTKLNIMFNWEDIIKKIQATIQNDITERFGLSEEQAIQSENIIVDHLRKLFSEDLLAKDFDLQALVKNFNDPEKNPLLQKLSGGLIKDLIEKAQLPKDIAEKINEFSGNELLAKIKDSFLGPDGKPDISKIMKNVDMQQMQQIAKGLMGKLGGLFGK